MREGFISGISHRFQQLSQSQGQVTHVLLTRSPLITRASPGSPFDLHVLSTPPAFVLSQNQTLRKCHMAPQNPKAQGNRHNERAPTQLQADTPLKSRSSQNRHTQPHQGHAHPHQPNQHTPHPPPPTTPAETRASDDAPPLASTTWHTVEFSRTGHATHQTPSGPARKATAQTYPNQPTPVNQPGQPQRSRSAPPPGHP